MERKPNRIQRNQRGAALMFVLVLSLLSTAMMGALVYTTMTWNTLSYSKTNDERALELAEAGINSELNYMSVQTRLGNAAYFHTNATQSGQPLPGQLGSLSPVPGKWWVYTKLGSNNNFTTTCSAEVGGILTTSGSTTTLTGGARRTISVTGQTGSLFGLYAAFAVTPAECTETSSFKLNGTQCVVTIVGSVGTDGTFQGGNNTCNYTRAIDANTIDAANSGKQFTASPLSSVPTPIWFPSVADMIRDSFSATIGMTDANAWKWLSTNNKNAGVLMWKSGASGAMSASTTTSAVVSGGYPRSAGNLSNSSTGDWVKANSIPGDSSIKALIFPPGDYYFQSMSLPFNYETEIVIDNAGLSVGGNPNNIPVRFWFDNAGTANDDLGIPPVMTNAADRSTFRIFYGKDGNTLNLDDSVNGPYAVPMVVYAVTAENMNGPIAGMTGTSVLFTGGNCSSAQLEIDGSLIADQIIFSGYCKIVGDPTDGNALDYGGGSGITGGYTDLGG